MIYLFSGNDTTGRRNAYNKLIKSFPKGIEIFSFEENNIDQAQVESFYSGSGLFFEKCVVVFRDSLEKKENSDFLLKNLDSMTSALNTFIFLEGKQNKPILDVFKKAGGKIELFENDKNKGSGEKFNSFILANALGERDKLSLWINFCRAKEAGVEIEALSGILFWKVKDMILKKNFSKFSEAELKTLSSKIACLIPESRKEGKDTESLFEEFLLEAV